LGDGGGEHPFIAGATHHIGELAAAIEAGQISGKQGKDVFAAMLATGQGPATIIKEKGFVQVSDTGALEAFCDQAIAGNPKSAVISLPAIKRR